MTFLNFILKIRFLGTQSQNPYLPSPGERLSPSQSQSSVFTVLLVNFYIHLPHLRGSKGKYRPFPAAYLKALTKWFSYSCPKML